MVSKTCATCRHKALDVFQAPCIDCVGDVFDGSNAFTKFEPIPESTEKENNNGNVENT